MRVEFRIKTDGLRWEETKLHVIKEYNTEDWGEVASLARIDAKQIISETGKEVRWNREGHINGIYVRPDFAY